MPEKSLQRVESVDFVRGLTMFLMIIANIGFVNRPWWMGHYSHVERGPSGMTWVDVIFPAFLFLVGISIPLGLRKYGDDWRSRLRMLAHIAIRTASLLLIGVIYLNVPGASMGGSPYFWRCVSMLAVILVWHRWEAPNPAWRQVSCWARWAGIVALAGYMLYFRGPEGEIMQHGWWEILGLIGWAYLGGCLVYLWLRRDLLLLGLGVFAVFAASQCGKTGAMAWIPLLADHHGLLYLAILPVCGTLIGATLLEPAEWKRRLGFFFRFFSVMTVLALCFTPIYGLSKDRGTPGWLFWSAAVVTAVLILAYDRIDVRQWRPWPVRFLTALGTVALTAYILWIFFFNLALGLPVGGGCHLMDIVFYPGRIHWLLGFGATALMSLSICATAVWLKHHRFRLQL